MKNILIKIALWCFKKAGFWIESSVKKYYSAVEQEIRERHVYHVTNFGINHERYNN